MARVELKDEMVEIPELRAHGRNRSAYRERLERALNGLGMAAYLNETTPNSYDPQTNAYVKCAIASTIPDSLFMRIRHSQSAHECFKTLKNLFEGSTSTTEVLREIRNDKNKQEAAHSPHRPNDRVRTRRAADTSRCDNEVSTGSNRRRRVDVPSTTSRRDDEVRTGLRRRNDEVPRSKTRRERKRGDEGQVRVERRRSRGREGEEAAGRVSEQGAAAKGPGRGATDQTTSSEGLAATPSSQDDDGDNVHVHHAHVVPQQPQSTRQTAVKEADDTVNPDVKNVRPTMPAGTSNEPVDNEVERQGEKDERDENDGDGDENVLHTHVVPHPTPPASEPPPPSTPLEGEQGDESSGHAREAATHDDEPPQAKPRGQDDDGTDDDVQDARVEPQEPQTTGQTAVNDEATDTSNPHANGAGTTMPVSTSNGRD
ncbi:hypothetical protein PAXINDRAFT_21029 [Paxillus involutus ATCC 200175]|uniref:Uncharacterized protein n=1 Tax=Paxillus involutus ATCC 200175 TaxID=664439 RepID=A0A0C9SM86_PAXIN|nr:hypothetical protein PAXINDRAFT_21029 [Paxillus involutus ATCC 200175]